jgi:O-antigen/teichoic acid export membrane protein
VYAVFLSITSLLGAVVCGRYEFGITLPAEDRKGLALLALCSVISLAFSAFLLPLVFLAGGTLTAKLGAPGLRPWLWAVPGATLVYGFSSSARYWLLRRKDFSTASVNGVLRATISAGANIAFGVLGWTQFGLIGGFLIGLTISALALATKIWQQSGTAIRTLCWADLTTQAYEQRAFPKYSLGSAIIEVGAAQFPVFFFSALFGMLPLGYFSFANRIANLPLSLVGTSIADVFRQQASEIYAIQGSCLTLFDRSLKRLLLMALPSFVFLYSLSPWLFLVVFGEQWKESGEYVRLLSPTLALRFVSSPLSSMFYIARRQATDLYIQAGLITAMLVAFGWGSLNKTMGFGPREAVIAYAAIYFTKYLVELVLSRRYARGGGK